MINLLKLLPYSHNIPFQVRFSSKSNLFSLLLTMPKTPKQEQHIMEAQKQRLIARDRAARYVPGLVSLEIIGSGAEGTPQCVYMFTDSTRYLFNCGEGTQRLSNEHKRRLSKLDHIFITRSTWTNIGGLPGMALTLQDTGAPELTLHGPKGLDEIFNATKRFVVLKNFQMKMADCSERNYFEDNVMKVNYVLFTKPENDDQTDNDVQMDEMPDFDKSVQCGSSSNQSDASTTTRNGKRKSRSESLGSSLPTEDDTTDYYSHERKKRRKSKHKRRSRSLSVTGKRTAPLQISEERKAELQETKKLGAVMSFVCRLHSRPGTLNLEKCVRLGVPAGPLLGKLKNGEDIVLKNGVKVLANDVRDPEDVGPVFLVVDCPTEEYLGAFVKNQVFQRYQKTAVVEEDLAYAVVHFTPQHVLETPEYRSWIDSFPPSTSHIILNNQNRGSGNVAIHRIQNQLNLVNDTFFPILGEDLTAPKRDETFNCAYPKSLFKFHLRPRNGYDRSEEVSINPEEYIKEALSKRTFTETVEECKKAVDQKRADLVVRSHPEILFLGTGSCIPNKTRNTSGILLRISDDCNILMDCGEGTYGQLVRFFGLERSKEVLSNITAVFVSHLHADHHIGLIGLLQGRQAARLKLGLEPKPVFLFAPLVIMSWLDFYNLCFEDMSTEYALLPNEDLMVDLHVVDSGIKSKIFEKLDMSDISTTYVKHCPNSFGVAFTHKSGYKVTYSGDTMPYERLVELGKNSDLLIHEATMEDSLKLEAIMKMHSTTSEAVDIGKRMKAKYTILTHFSQRYAKLPRDNECFTKNIAIAFDNMQVKLDELPLLPLLYPALRVLFHNDTLELEQKAAKRQRRMEMAHELLRQTSENS